MGGITVVSSSVRDMGGAGAPAPHAPPRSGCVDSAALHAGPLPGDVCSGASTATGTSGRRGHSLPDVLALRASWVPVAPAPGPLCQRRGGAVLPALQGSWAPGLSVGSAQGPGGRCGRQGDGGLACVSWVPLPCHSPPVLSVPGGPVWMDTDQAQREGGDGGQECTPRSLAQGSECTVLRPPQATLLSAALAAGSLRLSLRPQPFCVTGAGVPSTP